MIENQYSVTIELLQPCLGTIPKNKKLYTDYIASKAPTKDDADEEIATTPEDLLNKSWTGFHSDEDGYFLYNYYVKGYLCEAARTLKQFGAMKQLQDKFKRYVFVKERRVRVPVKGPLEFLDRPLRISGLNPRVALARSDMLPEGTQLTFTVACLQDVIGEACLREVLSYGEYMGVGAWRSGGWGQFKLVSLEEV